MGPSTTTAWDGNAMTQTDMMEKDTVLVLDDEDNVIGSASKRTSHEFMMEQPRGILHRAFSVFIFDESTGKLLLQKRASTKITFPNVRFRKGLAPLFIFCLPMEILEWRLLPEQMPQTKYNQPFFDLISFLPSYRQTPRFFLICLDITGMDEHLLFSSTSWNG